MARPKIVRKIACRPAYSCFKPNGVPMKQLPRLALASDELEALRLVDMLGMQQLDAAQQLGVSRQTLGNIIARGRHKVAQALVMGMALELTTDNTTNTED